MMVLMAWPLVTQNTLTKEGFGNSGPTATTKNLILININYEESNENPNGARW